MQPSRTRKSIRVLAGGAIAGIVILTAACSGSSNSAATLNPSLGSTGGSSTGSSTGGAGLGFYDGKSSPKGIGTAATWLGSASSVKYAMDFIDATDWSHITNPYQLPDWKGSPYEMIWGVPMLPCGAPNTQCDNTNASEYDKVASGGADDYFKTLAKNLVSAGFGTSYIRIGWEMNASAMGWSICNQDGSAPTSLLKDFVPAFRNIVTSMRSVSPNFKFIWNPIDSSNASCPGVHVEDLYPGDSYVDAVALDVYDGIGSSVSNSARFTDLLDGTGKGGYTAVTPNAINGQKFNGQGYGMNWLVAFGKEHNKEISLPEWGLESTSQNAGGGDDSYFVTHMADWIKANATGPVLYWNSGDGTLPLDIPNYTSGGTPTATAAFKAAFSSGV